MEAVAAPMSSTNEDSNETDLNAEVSSEKIATEFAGDEPTQSTNSIEANADDGVLYQVEFPSVDERGFYEMKLQNNDGGETPVLFAANVDASEGDLRRMSRSVLDSDFFGGNVEVVTAAQLSSQTLKGGSSELWMLALFILFAVLLVEQFLGWVWGRKR